MISMKTKQRLQTFLDIRLSSDKTSINHVMKMELSDCDQDKVELKFPVHKWQLNPMGAMHGGMLATAIDITMGCAAYTFSDAKNTPTISMNIQYLRSVYDTNPLYVKAIVDHAGGRIMQIRCVGWQDDENTPCITASGSYIVNIEH